MTCVGSFAVAGRLENERWDTGSEGAFCTDCLMWIGPHRDTEEEAEDNASRHREAVRQQRQRPSAHAARVTFDEHEAQFMKGLLEEYPDDDPHFGPYFADCGGYVGLGRITEEEAATEAQEHHCRLPEDRDCLLT
jgi:hypothetical protein